MDLFIRRQPRGGQWRRRLKLNSRVDYFRKRATTVFAAMLLLIALSPPAFAGNELAGKWTLTVTIPEAPGSSTTRTFAVNVIVSPRGESLHGRLDITDDSGKTVGGAWR